MDPVACVRLEPVRHSAGNVIPTPRVLLYRFGRMERRPVKGDPTNLQLVPTSHTHGGRWPDFWVMNHGPTETASSNWMARLPEWRSMRSTSRVQKSVAAASNRTGQFGSSADRLPSDS